MTGDELENLLRATLAEEAEPYAVSPGALGRLQQRTRRQPRRRFRIAWAAVAATAVAAAAVIGVSVTPHHATHPVTISEGSTPPQPTQSPTAAAKATPSLPAAVAGHLTVPLTFSADRLLLGGPDVWAFGMSGTRPRVSRINGGKVQRTADLASPVCSASIDNSDVIAVVYAGSSTLQPNGEPDCQQRGTLGLINATTLEAVPGLSSPAAGGDVLIRPRGIIVANAGVVSRLSVTNLGTIAHSDHIGSVNAIVNLASDPNQNVLFATVYDPGHATRLVRLDEDTLQELGGRTTLDAPQGALPYATDAGKAWVSLVSQGETSEAGLYSATGARIATAFPASPYLTNYAESGYHLWSLTDGGTLSCASLTTGETQASTPVNETGTFAADQKTVYVAVQKQTRLDLFTAASACGEKTHG